VGSDIEVVAADGFARVELDTTAYSAIVSECEKVGQWGIALRLLVHVAFAREQLDTITYSAAFSAYEKGGQSDQALRILMEM